MDSAAPRLVPELIVSDLAQSLVFYESLGFAVLYERPEERFAYLDREGAHLMLQEPVGRVFLAGELDAPFGRGVNFQIEAPDADALYDGARTLGAPVYLPIEEHWYRRGDREVGSRQFIVSDPDGYLLRFFQDIGDRRSGS